MRCRQPALGICLGIGLAGTTHGGDGPTPVGIEDLLRLRSARSVAVSPAGDFAVVAVESFAPAREIGDRIDPGDYERRSHLFRISLTDQPAELRPLTHGDRRDGDPRVSPDGRSIAFVRSVTDEDGRKKSQVWVLPLDGGEARPVTDLEHGASRPRWSPDGDRLVVASRVPVADLVESDGEPAWEPTRPARDVDHGVEGDPSGSLEEVRGWLDGNSDRGRPHVIDRMAFLGEREVENGLRIDQVFMIDVQGDDPPRRLGSGVVNRRDAVFSTHGGSVVMTVGDPEVHPEDQFDTSLVEVSIEPDIEDRVLFPGAGWRLQDPIPGRDGSLIAILGTRTDEPFYRGRQIGLVPAKGGEPIWATSSEEYDVRTHRWGSQAPAVDFTAPRQGAIPFFTIRPSMVVPSESNRVREGLPTQVRTFDVAGGVRVWAEASAGNPSRLWMEDAEGARMISDLNSWIADRVIMRPREGWVDRPDGVRVQYWLLPPNAPAETPSPLVLSIHGGPSAMWGPAEPTMWFEWQLAAAWGFGVVYANPRGSGGYGESFQRGNHQDWGGGPAGDCLAVLDDVATEPWVDPDRLVVTGGSYGGYLTAWIIGRDHRFKAAVAQRGVYDLQTFFGEGNAYRLVEWAFGGRPFDPRFRELMTRESPYHAAGEIRTPLLIMHGEKDLRTGVSQSAMLFRAVKSSGGEVEYVRYPDADHDLSRRGDPVVQMDRLLRILEFFSRFAGPTRMESEAESPGNTEEEAVDGVSGPSTTASGAGLR